jgi:hypothetical protein
MVGTHCRILLSQDDYHEPGLAGDIAPAMGTPLGWVMLAQADTSTIFSPIAIQQLSAMATKCSSWLR